MMKASNKTIALELLRLKRAFPNQDQGFFDLLMERILFHEFTPQELTKAVDNIIDTFEYKHLTIASIIKLKVNESKQTYIIPD